MPPVPMKYRKMLLPESRGSGIYFLVNRVTEKYYLGSTNNFHVRAYNHRRALRMGKHDNGYLQRAWDKYGEGCFEFLIFEECPAERCLIREQELLDALTPWDDSIGYNLAKRVEGGRLGRKHTRESRSKMSDAHRRNGNPGQPKATEAAAIANRRRPMSKQTKANMSASKKGIKFTHEHREAIKEAHWTKKPGARAIIERTAAANRGKKHTEEHKEKIRESTVKNHWRHRPDAAEIAEKTASKNRGKKQSPETKANMSIAQTKRWARLRGEIE